MKLAVAIQHHPARADLLAPLLTALDCSAVIVSDPDPEGERSAWRTYRAALEAAPASATHLLVVQDDASPCRHAVAAARQIIEIKPEALLTLFVGGRPQGAARKLLAACERDEPLANIGAHPWVPAVAVVWPTSAIEAALAFVDAQRWPVKFNADDEIIGRIAKKLGLEVWATVPSLVQHEDLVPSVTGGRRARGGHDPGRLAACFIPDLDALSIDWAKSEVQGP
jgi:hypothetical protein